MRKLISILLLLLFANPIFATTPPTPKIETTLNIEITKDTERNLQSAAEAFFNEIEEKKTLYDCNEKNKETDFCKRTYPQTKKFKDGITFPNPTTEKDFEEIVAFYNELKTFKKSLTDFENKLNSKKKNDIISEINAISKELNLNDLIEKLNEENELLNTALKQVEAKNENKIQTTTKITQEQFEKINTKINTINPKINIKELKLEQHTKEAIEIPTIPSTEELNNENETGLKEILKNLQELQTRIQEETKTANDNISKLIKENDKNINDALQKLKDAKKEQAELLSQLGKNKITINNGNNDVENTNLNNDFPEEAKDSTYQPNKVVTDLTVENIEKETKNVQHNNELLKEYIKKLENCKKELNKYTDDINDINNINTLAKCNEKKLEQEDIKKQKECIFDQLKQCSNAIESKKISLFGTNSRLKDGNPDGYSYLKESTLSQNCGSKTNPIINDDGTKDSILLFKPETECKIPGKTIKIISVEEAEKKLKTCIGNLTLLNKIEEKCGNITPTQKEGINDIYKYITVDKILKKCENGRPLFQGSPTNEINENKVIKQCMNTLKSQKCIEYATAISTEIYKYAFKTSADTTANCQSIIEDTFCQEYATNKNVELISFKPTSTSGTNDKTYSQECKKYVDENILNFTEYENLMRKESDLLNELSSITANDLIKKYAIEKHQCIEGTGGNKRNRLCSNTNIKTKSDLNSTVNIINKNIIKLEEIIENQKKVDDIIAKLNNACTENKELKGYNKDTLSEAIDYIRLNLKCKDGNSPVPENIQNIALKIYEKFNPNQHYSGVNKLTCGNKPQFLRRFSTNPAELLTGAPTCKKE